jgi:hypothetical protein
MHEGLADFLISEAFILASVLHFVEQRKSAILLPFTSNLSTEAKTQMAFAE